MSHCGHCGKPRLLDAFSCAGGAGMGYHQAGFCVTGIDISPQPNYPFAHIVGDAVAYIAEHGHEYAAIHGSPPCQFFANVTNWRGSGDDHENLIPDTRKAMQATGRPWVIENVPEAIAAGELRPDYLFCGSMFGLNVRRHRGFETSWGAMQFTPPCMHHRGLLPFEHKGERAYADAMGCTWMSKTEGRQAIPPAFTEHIGLALMDHLTLERAA